MSARSLVRQVPVRVLTSLGWIEGTMIVPRLHALLDHLETSGSLLVLHRASLPGRPQPLEKFLLPRAAALLILPSDDGALEREPPRGGLKRRVACLLPEGLVEGDLVTHPVVALGSFLLHHPGFLLLHDAHVALRGGERLPGTLPHVIVSAGHLIGVAEVVPPQPSRRAPAPRRAPAAARGARP